MRPVVVRVLMWVFIVSSVWLAARYHGLTPEQDRDTQALLDAARHYQAYKARSDQAGEIPPVVVRGSGNDNK